LSSILSSKKELRLWNS